MLNFFGLQHSDKLAKHEQLAEMVTYGNYSWTEVYREMPNYIRRLNYGMLRKKIEIENKTKSKTGTPTIAKPPKIK